MRCGEILCNGSLHATVATKRCQWVLFVKMFSCSKSQPLCVPSWCFNAWDLFCRCNTRVFSLLSRGLYLRAQIGTACPKFVKHNPLRLLCQSDYVCTLTHVSFLNPSCWLTKVSVRWKCSGAFVDTYLNSGFEEKCFAICNATICFLYSLCDKYECHRAGHVAHTASVVATLKSYPEVASCLLGLTWDMH